MKRLAISMCLLLCVSAWGQSNKPPLGTQINWDNLLSRGLIGYWAMTEGSGPSIADLSGNGGTGTIINAIWAGGKFGSCLSFDGNGDYVSVPDNDLYTFGDGNVKDKPFSVSMWIFYKNLGSDHGFISKYNNTYPFNGEWVISGKATTGQIYFQLNDGGVFDRMILTGSASLSTNTWYHVVCTYSGSSLTTGMALYINGKKDPSPTLSTSGYSAMHNDAAPLEIGATVRLVYPKYMNGLIDQVAIYNRGLSASEVTSLYLSPFGILMKGDENMALLYKAPVAGGGGQVIMISE